MITKTGLSAQTKKFADRLARRQAQTAQQDQQSSPPPTPLFVVEPSQTWFSLQVRDLWEYRELFYFLVWRDIKVRYKQTVLGAAWAVLQPFMTMVVFSVFFGELGNMPSDGIPYPIFAYAALVPWQLFAYSLSASGQSLIPPQHLISKVYFPRLIMPLSAVFVGLVDFGLSFIVLLGLMIYYGILPTMAILALPLFIILTILTALAVGLWLAALNVQYRDVQYTIPFLTQFWLFITPIAYSSNLVPEQWRAWYGLNPMVGVVEGFRWALLGGAQSLNFSVLISMLMVLILLAGGLVYFRLTEKIFADVV